MSQENMGIVRMPLRVREESNRTLGQRFCLRFPRFVRPFARLVGRLPLQSRLRHAVISRSFRQATEALNRRDLEAALIGYHAERELHPPREFVAVGFAKSSYRGPAGFRDYIEEWSDVWGRDLRVEPAELIDLGNRLVALGRIPSRGQASGVPLSQEWASVMTLRGGEVITQQDYLDSAEALEAAGLSE